jgi:hypothetical protein
MAMTEILVLLLLKYAKSLGVAGCQIKVKAGYA